MAVAVFSVTNMANLAVSTRTSARGAVTVKPLTKKDFREQIGLSEGRLCPMGEGTYHVRTGKETPEQLKALTDNGVVLVNSKPEPMTAGVLKRKHKDYLCQLGVRGNQNIASLIAGGEIALQKWTERKDKHGALVGYNASFLLASELAEGTVKGMSTEELTAEVMARAKAQGIKLDDKALLALVTGQPQQQANQPQK